MDTKRTALIIGLAVMPGMAKSLRAQTGCDDSPEDPTVILALLAGAGAFAAGLWRSRSRTP